MNKQQTTVFGRKSADNQPDDLAVLSQKLNSVMDNVKNFGEDVAKKMKSGADVTEELKTKTDKALTEMNEIRERMAEIEQKSVREKKDGQQDQIKSWGQMLAEKAGEDGMNSSRQGRSRVQIERKDMMNVAGTVGAGASGTNSLVVADRAGFVMPAQRTMTIRELIAQGATGSNSVEYVVETGFTNNAAPVAEGGAAAKSDITFNLKTAPVRTVAHIFKASRQLLDDSAGLASYIDARAQYGLRFKEELQILSGDGTGSNILGIIPQAQTFVPPIASGVGTTPIDRLRLAILQSLLAEYPASAFVLNPIDWAKIELTKDSEGRYIISSPVNGGVPRLWGLPVAETQAMASGNFLTGAFGLGAQIYDRKEIEVMLSTENVDDFEKGMVTIRAEERLALAVYRPEAFVTGAVSAA